MSRPLRAALEKLRRDGPLPASRLTAAQRRALEDFARQTGAVSLRPAGSGVLFEIREPALVERHWRELTPMAASALDAALPSRSVNLARHRSSKGARHGHDQHYLLLRAEGPAIWRDHAGNRLDLAATTRLQGATALAVSGDPDRDAGWHAEGDLWLVENQALFDRLDWLPDTANASVAWYAGQLPRHVLDWLAARPRAGRLWFFPDYDGVGLLNHARLHQRLGDRVRFWLMPDWAARLARFGSHELWLDTQREFQAALPRLEPALDADSALHGLVRAMRESARALEQEAVWLRPPD